MHRRGTILVAAAALAVCTAGPALAQLDNSSRHAVPLLPVEIDQELLARMLFICGGASGASRFNVAVRHAAPNTNLTLAVNGIERATVTTNAAGAARFRFRSVNPVGATLPLDFDPRDATVEVEDASGPVATNETGDGSTPDGARIQERVALTSTGVLPGAGGRVRLRERRGVRDLDVEIEGVPDGAYSLLVDGVERGTITAAGGEGQIEFSDGGDDPDELLLDFDPMAALLQVAQGSTVILSGTLLADSPGVSVCTPSESTTELGNAGPDPDANGDARFRVRDDCDRDFRVEIEDLPVGAYEVVVGGVTRGTIEVVDLGLGETDGELEFDTDVDEPLEVLLDFDPVGQTVEIRQGATVFLSSTIGDPGPGSCDAVADEPSMTGTGADPDADGKARFRQEIDCDRDFRVEVDDLDVGSYELLVGGIVRGTIEVVDLGGGDTEGSLDFDNDPDEADELLLDFDPRGQVVEVRQGATVFLAVTMAN